MQITTHGLWDVDAQNCCLYHKDTKLNANHNLSVTIALLKATVAYITKILN